MKRVMQNSLVFAWLMGAASAVAAVPQVSYHRSPCAWLLAKNAYHKHPSGTLEAMEIMFSPEPAPHGYFLNLSDIKTALFLGDGIVYQNSSARGTDAQRWAQVNEQIAVISADIDAFNQTVTPNLSTATIDHRQKFPLADDSQDLVVMRRGLCKCHGEECCGGFEPQSEAAWNFFSEVVRVLNKNNPHAVAYLHGSTFLSYEEHVNWAAMLDFLRLRHTDLNFAFYSTEPIISDPHAHEFNHKPEFLKIWFAQP